MTDPFADLRPARETDVTRLESIIAVAYDKYLTRMDRPPAPMLRDLRPDIEAGNVWVAGNPIAGLICLAPADDALLIGNVAVDPNAQGRGFGRLLLDFAEHHAFHLGIGKLRLYTNEVMTENLAIYTHLGYREIDRRTEAGYSRVFMEKQLPHSAERSSSEA